MLEGGLVSAEGPERVSESESNVDAVLQRLLGLGKMGERGQRLLEVRHRVSVGRAGEGFGRGLPQVGHCLVPELATESMVGQLLDVLGQPVGIEPLEGFDDPAIEGSPPILEQAAIGHVVSQGMLEGVLEVWEDPGLVQELCGLQAPERGVQVVVGGLGNRLQQPKRDVLPDHRRRLKQSLVPGWQTVDARRQHRLYCGRDLDGWQRSS